MLWIKRVMTTILLTVARCLSVIGFVGCVMLAFVPLGCGSGLFGEVHAQQAPSIRRPAVPEWTVERLKACMHEYGGQLEPRQHVFSPNIQVNREGATVKVTTDDIPNTAPDFATCVRLALEDMSIPTELLNRPADRSLSSADTLTSAQRSQPGFIVVVVGVLAVFTELTLEAGAYTILFAITVELIDKAIDDVAELAKRQPNKHDRCVTQCLHLLPSPSGDLQSSEYRKCYRECMGRL